MSSPKNDSKRERRYLHRFLLPESMDSFRADLPLAANQHVENPFRAKAGTLPGKAAHLFQQITVQWWSSRLITLRRTGLTQYAARTPLGNAVWPQATTCLSNRPPASLGDLLSFTKIYTCLSEFGNDLIDRLTILLHRRRPFWAHDQSGFSHFNWINLRGERT